MRVTKIGSFSQDRTKKRGTLGKENGYCEGWAGKGTGDFPLASVA